MWRKTVIEAMSAVEREYRAAARGVALLAEHARADLAILRAAVVTRRDLQQCESNLEDTLAVSRKAEWIDRCKLFFQGAHRADKLQNGQPHRCGVRWTTSELIGVCQSFRSKG
jgi:hypothetical protein